MAETQTRLNQEEEIAAHFAQPTGSALVPSGGRTDIAIQDNVITAQKVAVQRSHERVMANLRVVAQEAGSDFFYRFPVKNRRTGETDWIEGPSIKCANNVARLYGNCKVDTRVFDQGDSWIIYAQFVDYETGYSLTRPFQQRKGQASVGGKDSGRQLDIALQIGVSKAIRNVVCNALDLYSDFAFEEARSSIVDKVGKNMERYKGKVAERLGDLHIDLRRVEAAVGRPLKDWLATDLTRVIAQLQAINDGMATIDETWAPAEGTAAPPRPTRESVANEQRGQQTPPQEAAETAAQQQREDPLYENGANLDGAVEAQRDAEDAAQAETGSETDDREYHVTDLVGEITSYPIEQVQAAFGRLIGCLRDAARSTGQKGIEAIDQSNEALLASFRERGHKELADQYSQVAAMLREMVGDSVRNPKDDQQSSNQASPRDEAERPDAGERGSASGRSNRPASSRKGSERSSEGGKGTDTPSDRTGGPSEGRGNSAAPQGGPAEQGGGPAGGHQLSRPPVPRSDDRDRSGIWDNESLRLELPMKQDKTVNFQVLRDMLENLSEQALTRAELAKFEADNADHLRRLEEAYPTYANAVRATWQAVGQRLPG